MKLVFSEEEQAFINAFNTKVELYHQVKTLSEANLLSDAGVTFKGVLETYITANLDKWVELQNANNS